MRALTHVCGLHARYCRWRANTLITLTLLLGVAACTGAAEDTSDAVAPTATPSAASATRAPPPTAPRPTATLTAPAFDPIQLSGSGDDVVAVRVPGDAPAIVALTHDGSANFVVRAHDEVGQNPELLVNSIGEYEGTRPLNFDPEPVRELEITADGSWTATVRPVREADRFTGDAEGSGDAVLITPRGFSGRLDLTHDGERNFVVHARGTGLPDLLVNDIGTYDGAVRVSDASALIIQADGRWTITEAG